MAGWDIEKPSQVTTPTVKGRTIILVPHGSDSDYREWRDWFHNGLQKPEGTQWLETRGQSLVTARNYLVQEGLKTRADYLFFLDDDVMGPSNGLVNLMSTGLPIACGLYMAKKKKEERGLAAWMKNPNGTGYLAIQLNQNGRFVSVDVTGMGFALIHRSVFERVTYPWFEWGVGGPSEDFFFYEKVAKEIGIKPVISIDTQCRHIGTFAVDCLNEFTTLG